jgi:hypothetical protein
VPHVLELVLELDFLGDGDAVLGDARGAEALVEHHVAALGAERHLHGIVENVDAAQHLVARVDREFDFLGSHFSRVPVLTGSRPAERLESRPRNETGWIACRSRPGSAGLATAQD